ncbi:sugar ABC transporter substrate-binding protein [Kribbella sancticallisti]|uniref:Sugar ABC transporter substrate-binding protein n=1 Tax=Kribbella sancticallisti TaxID=460087 RepID=A0ABP4NFL4_9ACTN
MTGMARAAGSIDRRKFLKLTAGVGSALLLSSCGDDGERAGSGQPVYWTQPNAGQKEMQAFLTEIEKGFAADNPGMTAKTLLVPWEDSLTKYTAAFSAGNPPDVTYQIIPWMNKWRDSGVLADFRDIAPKEDIDKLLENVNPSLLKVAQGAGGELRAIPYVTDSGHNLTVNLNVWEKAGKPPFPTTYAEMIDFAKAMTVDAKGRRLGEAGFDKSKVDHYGMTWPTAPAIQENYVWHYFWSFGTEYISEDGRDIGFDNEAGRGALENMKEMVDSGAATPPGLYTDESKWANAMVSGRSGMQWTHALSADQAKAFPAARLKLLEPPNGPGGDQFMVGGCGYIAVAAKSKNREAAYKLAKHILSPGPKERYTRLILGLPINGSAGAFYTELPDPRMNEFMNEASKMTRFQRIPPALKYQPNEYLIGKINDYVTGRQSLDDMIRDARNQIKQMAAAAG